MLKRGTRSLFYLMVIATLLLASCSSGSSNNNGQSTQSVPNTGQTPTTGAGAAGGAGAGQATATQATGAGQATATQASGAGASQATATQASGTGQATATATQAAGGAGQTTQTPTAGAAAGQTTQTPTAGGAGAATAKPWKGEKIGGTVSVLAIWGGDELKNFQEMIKPFEEQTGIKVQYEGTRDLGAVLNTRVQGGNPPDLAGLPNPGQLVALANSGALKPLNDVLDMNMMNQQYDPGFLKLATVNNKMYGIWTKAAVKSLVWYDPKQFQAKGYQVPKTYKDLQDLEQKIIADGATPWCIGIDGGAGSGWPGTDWIEDIMLHQFGPEYYDKWVNHDVPWTDANVKQAFQTWGKFVADPKMAYGGPQYIIATNFGTAFAPMFQNPPKCYLHRQASFITTFFTQQDPNVKAGQDYNFFLFPGIDPQYDGTLEVAGDLFGMFKDTPQARALIQYLVTPDAQSIWAKRGGFISANKLVDPKVYPDQISQQIGQLISTAKAVRFDGSDLMPEGVNSAFSQAVLQYVQSPNQLDSILQQVESTAASSYQKK